MKPWRWTLAAFLAALAVFLPAVFNGFIPGWDDGKYLLENPFWRGFSPQHLRWMFTAMPGGPYQPLTWLSFALDDALWGLDPRAFHLTSVLLHAANAALFQRVAARLLRDEKAGLAAALLFALHPLRVESVAWVFERRDVLSGFFLLASLLCRQRGERGVSLALYAASLASKAIALGFPFVLLAVDWIEGRRDLRKMAEEKAPYFALAFVFGALAWWGQRHAGATLSLEDYAAAPRALLAVYAANFYLLKTLLPLGLSPLYELPYDLTEMNHAFSVSSLSSVLIAVSCIYLWRRGRPAPALALLSFLALAGPVLGLVKVGMQTAADRYTYIACLPLALLAGAAVRGRARTAVAAGLCLLLAGLSVRQIAVWKDDRTLWTRALEVPGPHAVALFQLAGLSRADGDWAVAESLYRGSVEVRPDFAEAHNNLGALLASRGRKDEARKEFEAALERRPDYAKARANLDRLTGSK